MSLRDDIEAVYNSCRMDMRARAKARENTIYFLNPDILLNPMKFWAEGYAPQGARHILFGRGKGRGDVMDWKAAVRRLGLRRAAYLFEFHGLKWRAR